MSNTLQKEKKSLQGKEQSMYSAKSHVADYRALKSPKTRKRRSASPEQNLDNLHLPLSLTKQQRETLESFFKSWSNLNEEQKSLFNKLREASKGDVNSGIGGHNSQKVNKVLDSLRRINWKGDKLQLTPIRGGKPEDPKNVKKETSYGWKFDKYKWEDSPWDIFFNQENDWVGIMESLQNSRTSLEKYLRGRRACGILLFIFRQDRWCTKDRDRFAKWVTFSEGSIGLHIADWMIKRMEGQEQL